MNVLCVAAHPDDEVLGPGGTLARHAAEGDAVHVCILADGVASRFDEVDAEVQDRIDQRRRRAREACGHLGVESTAFHDFPDNQFDAVPLLDIVQTIEAELDAHDPAVVYTHHWGDLNVDHERACRATVTACRPLADGPVERLLAFETLSATEWSVPSPGTAFQPRHFVNISDQLESKLQALETYRDELRPPPHPRNRETVRQNAEVWGAKAGVPAAEAFDVLRDVRR